MFGGEAGAFETNEIERGELILSVDHAVRGDILADGGIALHDGIIADVDELVKSRATAEEASLADADVPGEEDVVGEHIVIADLDIVRQMHTCHEEIVMSDASDATGFRSAVDGHIFAERVVFPDFYRGIGAGIEVQVLRVGADDGAPTDAVIGCDGDFSLDQDMACDLAVIANGDGAIDDREGTDANMFANLCLRRDEGAGMDE